MSLAREGMNIRREQMEAMDIAMLDEYQRRLTAFYRERAPRFISRFSEDQLKIRIAAAGPRAREFGLSTPEGILQYVGLALAAGPKFEETPAVQN